MSREVVEKVARRFVMEHAVRWTGRDTDAAGSAP
jgi:hypothetical protein